MSMPQNSSDSQRGTCIILTGLSGCGNTAVGRCLAKMLGLGNADTDDLIAATYGISLQHVKDALPHDVYADMEAAVIQSLNLQKCVISVGGGVCYNEQTMAHLRSMGILIYCSVPPDALNNRISEELYTERDLLYKKYADWTLQNEKITVQESANAIVHFLQESYPQLCVPAKH